MKSKTIRVRFAPAPTGMMHLGNIRAALINYLFASQKHGTFVLRIEDTDPQRNFDSDGTKIREDLAWLGLTYDEGPGVGGPYEPYFQSKRTDLYQKKLAELKNKNLIYRCFCTQEELEKKRQRQRALKLPPRYDRTCLNLSQEKIDQNLSAGIPFVWRFMLDHNKTIEIHDLAHGTVRFELSNFSDFPITRQNGTFTFMFSNFVDDYTMNITHIFRGEDHLTNTAGQAALFLAFETELPMYWHMPILCNTDGKKLSKRDFGFSLRDLIAAGFLPEAICNYLGIIGGSFKDEIMSLNQLSETLNFDHISTTGHITYDVEKLKWVNRKWIDKLNIVDLAQRCRPSLEKAYPKAKNLSDEKISQLLSVEKTEMNTLNDCVKLLSFYFKKPKVSKTDISAIISEQNTKTIHSVIAQALPKISVPSEFVKLIKTEAKKANIAIKEFFWFLRLAMMGSTKGPGIVELIEMLENEEATSRIQEALALIENGL